MKQFALDPVPAVKESCEVALDFASYLHSNEFEYADALQKVRGTTAKKD